MLPTFIKTIKNKQTNLSLYLCSTVEYIYLTCSRCNHIIYLTIRCSGIISLLDVIGAKTEYRIQTTLPFSFFLKIFLFLTLFNLFLAGCLPRRERSNYKSDIGRCAQYLFWPGFAAKKYFLKFLREAVIKKNQNVKFFQIGLDSLPSKCKLFSKSFLSIFFSSTKTLFSVLKTYFKQSFHTRCPF